jgi:hypothetical protein
MDKLKDKFTFILNSPGESSSDLQIAKLGDFKDPRYGEFSITKDDVETWKKNLSELPGGIALIDEDHSSNKTGGARKTEAHGWINDIYLDDKEVPRAKVEWTTKGETAIKDKLYRFYSPTYGPYEKEDGTIVSNVFQGGALTNKPKLNMGTVNLSSADSMIDTLREDNETVISLDALYESGVITLDISDEDRKKYATIIKTIDGKKLYMFPLPPGDKEHARAALRLLPHSEKAGNITAAEAAKVKNKAQSILGKELEDTQGQMDITSDTLTGLGITDEAAQKVILQLASTENVDTLKVLEAIEIAKPKPAPVVDPAVTKTLEQTAKSQGMVLLDEANVKALLENATAGAEAKKELEDNHFDTAFEQAVGKGKAVPAQKDQYKEFYATNKESTLKMLEDNPVILNTTAKGASKNEPFAPDGVHAPGYELHQEVQKYMEENKLNPSVDYEKALTAVTNIQLVGA